MRFHTLAQGRDEHGDTPTTFFAGAGGKRDRGTYAKLIQGDGFWERPRTLPLVQDPLHQGPPRFTDLTSLVGDGSPWCDHLVVSERAYEVMRRFILPAHRAYEAEVRFAQGERARYGDLRGSYRLLHWLDHSWLEHADLATTALRITVRLLSERDEHFEVLPPGSVTTSAQVRGAMRRFGSHHGATCVVPEALGAASRWRAGSAHLPVRFRPVDLVWMPCVEGPMLSDDLSRALRLAGMTGLEVTPWGKPGQQIDAPEMDVASFRAARGAELAAVGGKGQGAPAADAPARRVLAALASRRRAILARNDRVRAHYAKRERAFTDRERQLRRAEERLGVLLPAVYRERWLAGEDRSLPDGSSWFPPSKLLSLEELDAAWAASRPEATRAVLIAENGGDYVGFILAARSDVQLGERLMRFKHETGEVLAGGRGRSRPGA